MKTLSKYSKWYYQKFTLIVFLLCCILPGKILLAQEPECAEVKIVIEQKLSFERQAFDAHMVINNGLTDSVLENVKIELLFTDQNNQPITITQDPNAVGAKFFYRTNSLAGIDNIDGTGEITAKSTAEIHWLIIPSFGAAETGDTLYYIGAKVSYTLNGQESTVEVTPDYVVVKTQPMLTLDYFLPSDVYADDPFTAEEEPAIPFILGVRIKNTGLGTSYKTFIDSAQPKIVENKQGLLIDFKILGGYVADQPAGNSLLLNFGDIGPLSSTVGRWNMVSSLSGRFIAFDATFTHADELGGEVTSLLQAVNTHTLVHDVKVDLAGRDNIRDFLALDGDFLKIYESEGNDAEVIDQSNSAQLTTTGNHSQITFPATTGFVYVKIVDPFNGTKYPNDIKRSDNKELPSENIWLSKTRNSDLSWSYFINIFDTNSTGSYSLFLNENPQGNSSISGIVYNDLNGNGLLNDNESGIGNIEVALTGTDETGNQILTTAFTDQTGQFTFINLAAGTYSISIGTVDGMIDGVAYPGITGGTPGKGQITNIVLNNNTLATNNIFAKQSINQEIPTGNADISISINIISQGSSNILLGRHALLLVTVKNNGPDKAKNIYLEPLLPPNIEITSEKLVSGKYNSTEGRIDKLKTGASTKIILKVRVISKDGKGDFIGRINAQTADPDLTNNMVKVQLHVRPTPNGDTSAE